MIYKYPLDGVDVIIPLPKGTHVLCVQEQRGIPTIWALVPDISTDIVDQRRFVIVNTGEPQPSGLTTYIGTFQLGGGNFVGHLFELANENTR